MATSTPITIADDSGPTPPATPAPPTDPDGRRPPTTTTPSARSALSVAPRSAAQIAGLGYLTIFALAIFGNFFVLEALVVDGDPVTTAANLRNSQGLFRLGLVAFLVVFAVDVVLAWALHMVFRPFDAELSLVTAWSRLTYTVFLGVGLVFWFEAVNLVKPDSLTAIGVGDDGALGAQVMSALQSCDATWLIGLFVFGLHLVGLGTMILRSGVAPRIMGWLLVVAGVAYAVDTVAHLVLTDYQRLADVLLAMVAVPSMIGEGWLGLWLLTRAHRRRATNATVIGA